MKLHRHVEGFIEFIRERGVVSLAVAFIIAGGVAKLVTAFVNDILSPIIGLLFGKINLQSYSFSVGEVNILWGDFISVFLDFLIVIIIVYFFLKFLRLEKLDKKKEEDKEKEKE